MKLKSLLDSQNLRYKLNLKESNLNVLNIKVLSANQILLSTTTGKYNLKLNASSFAILSDQDIETLALKLQESLINQINWEVELSQALSYKEPVKRVLKTLSKQVVNPVIILNSSLSILGSSAIPKYDWQSSLTHGYIRVNSKQLTPLKEVLASPEIIKGSTFSITDFRDQFYAHQVTLRNDDYFIFLVVDEQDQHFKDDISKIEAQIDKISAAVGLHNFPYQSNNSNFEGIIRDLLTRPNLSHTELSNRLQFEPRQLKRPLAVVCLSSKEQHSAPYGTMLTRCLSIHYDQYDVYILENVSPTLLKTLQQELSGYLMQEGIHLGISDSFEKLHQLNRYFRQATNAITYSNQDEYFSLYKDHRTQALINHLRQDNSLALYINLKIKALSTEDTKLFDTLRRYLSNSRNKKLTAQDLHIHRSTLDYRLNQINEKHGIDPDNERNFVYYLLSVLFS
ncbi:hypothetical protein FOD75_11275 (plasmid) [Limosilactobacillus reuteri]|uniref:PucR C-terminal helix-turn-helix domain-containing protein n=1 Tax=Limosilactobacillus reuteri TaxID=1598 RepID=A0A517D8K3_LIMRT|nr:helix-turn-helix domain-containing protein [Limosilactobacillus reuteri]QDR73666.1 hypothetical protein FOD75_11275 [Limosilactobacillus reuteri]